MMQVQFSSKDQQEPHMREAASILRSCVRCGMCTAHCPTYQLLGNEGDSPRGRIYLIKQMLEEGGTPSEKTVLHLDRCLSCFACSSICPSEVDYRHLLDQARAYIEDRYHRPLFDRLLRNLLAWLMVRPTWFKWALRSGRPFRSLARMFPQHSRLAALLGMIPRNLPTQAMPQAGWHHPKTTPVARVGLFLGCVQTVLAPILYQRTIALLNRYGVSVYVPDQAHCCGAIVHHMGKEKQAKALARDTISALADHVQWDGLIVNVSGCGSTLKDYEHLVEGGRSLAKKTFDITEFLAKYAPPQSVFTDSSQAPLVAYHGACTLQHGQRIVQEPKQLLQQAGFRVVTPAESHLCCGSAGTYNMLQPEISQALAQRKAENIQRLQPDYVAAGNIGCLMQISRYQSAPTVHVLELLDWAYGGTQPHGIDS